jgi:hypothetical protein
MFIIGRKLGRPEVSPMAVVACATPRLHLRRMLCRILEQCLVPSI